MARPESIALAGYYPFPQHLIPHVVGHLTVGDGSRFNFVDPCAGDGAAVVEVHRLLGGSSNLYTCEMEASRHATLVKRLQKEGRSEHRARHGDAFRLKFSAAAFSLLLLNPPYDLDAVHGRLEQRFLERFTDTLVQGGVLLFVVPYYALKASAETLALTYDNVQCFRLPKAEFDVFKQVVVFANRVEERLAPDLEILERVQGWAEGVKGMPVLGSKKATHEVRGSCHYSPDWELRELDLAGLLSKARPWRETPRSKAAGTLSHVPHVLPEMPVQDLLFRVYPVATEPRPAHIGSGIASGLFNGRQVSSETRGMPDLLVKGMFTRDFVTISTSVSDKGEVSAVQVQAPKLETTILNLKTKRYSTLAPAGKGETDKIEGLSINGLLKHYGPSLLDVMAQQCPVSYDPKRDAEKLPLAAVKRRLLTAQGHAARAIFQLLGGPGLSRSERRFKSSIFLGEIGTGKTAVTLTVGKTVAKRMLAFCPPHLLDVWRDETRAIAPEAEFRVLRDLSDVDALVNVPEDRFLVAVVTRETAKLGHGYEAVSPLLGCPKCGAPLPKGVDIAKKRACCEAKSLSLGDDLARAAFALALKLAPHGPKDGNVVALLDGRHLQRYLAKLVERQEKAEWKGFDRAWVQSTLAIVKAKVLARYSSELAQILCELLLADYQPEQIAALAVELSGKKQDYQLQGLARILTCLLPFRSELQATTAKTTYVGSSWEKPSLEKDLTTLDTQGLRYHGSVGSISLVNGELALDGLQADSLALARSLLSALATIGYFPRAGEPCGEPLYQAIPEPRRFPLSDYIAKYYPDFFDLLALDEGQDYANGDSAQSLAAHRLTALGIPTILMTGSLMNGYASSLFTNMWYLSPAFREEFGRDDLPKYLNRYGYRKRIVTGKDMEKKEAVSFGSNSDRIERSERLTGHAPGILPLFLFRHLLAISVTLHKSDLEVELPPCRHITEEIEPSKEQARRYNKLAAALKTNIRRDQFSELSGKLFGALSELPSYLDRASADAGNQDDGSYGIYYPESVGGHLVAKVEPFAAEKILPKEQWMLDKVKAELAEGRNVMVFGYHVSLLPRLARLIQEATGEKVPVLYSDKVPTAKRQEWINKNIILKGARVMVANPVGISTGLNNLVHFSTEIWMENPGCHPLIFRQANGRIYRIGQDLETRIYFPIYKGTMQAQLHHLLMIKVAVSTATDGLDSESVLLAAGAGDDALCMGLSIGRQLWEMINREN